MSPRRHVHRARRFPVSVPGRARPQGHSTWRDADVLNVSRTGVLVAVAASFPPAESIDLVFALSDGTARIACVTCAAHIVREERDAVGRQLLAAAIDQHDHLPQAFSD